MEKKPEAKRVYATIIIGFMWLLALGLWLFFYAENFSIIQNIAAFIISIVIIGALCVALWVPWAMKNG
ncbi:hypothetical protein [Methanobacterium alcaliphilum]|uniref:hypothetical protein n=1 Tax=Methanobacterium alcaliphilum TaxID=392018 RepID=UPI00200AE4F0|nr:hypothetical protein [Methanobacterium alcaliphilum]MCK9152334.1 hypothetical protein [Methanobacterium alcaliphilum]